MSSKIVKVTTNGRRIFVDPKKKTATHCNAQIVASNNKSSSSRRPPVQLGKRKRSNECEGRCSSCSRRSVLKNYSNFMKSGLPKRLLFSQDGQWVDFSLEVVNLVKEGFQSKRAAIEVKSDGCHFMLDILYMIQVDLKTGAHKPIAWIDDAGSCVFPELYSSCHSNHEDLSESSKTPEINLRLEIEINGLDDNKVEECVGESNVKRIKAGQEMSKRNHAIPVEEKQKNDEYASPVFGAVCGILNVETARNMFIACLGSDLKVDDFEVKKCSSGSMEAQFELFQKQVEITQKLRGEANVQYGWFAAAGVAPLGVMFYGPNGPKLGMYGYGVHLAAVQPANLSTMICDDDEKGLKHMVLCRVILGNTEVVHLGSKQFCPSDQCFDSGVDDLQNPNNYVIWNSNMNTHIFPEFVISFKTSRTIKVGDESRPHMSRVTTTHDPHGLLNQDFSSNKMGKTGPEFEVMNPPSHEKVPSVGSSKPKEPKSPWMPFSMLFEAISSKVSPSDMKLVHVFYESFRAQKMNRTEFIRKLRTLVGDQILRSTIPLFYSKKLPNSASKSEAKAMLEG
ncbi:hypothetical protein QVD17_40060 [Tagetes erecta]|uniref:Inactive poly [ADP-ribose] polymerase RCD1-like n=1 Tax=Tagetes erecta TaxID=13708 RepID=A0AAD8JPL6_TARER|nr:hypothetical protein QVD17_40060 [Tagetes erecta]